MRRMFVEAYSYDNELITKGRQEGYQEGHVIGRQEAWEEVQKEKIETAQAGLLAKGIDLDTIAFLTKLDMETIEQLKQETAKNKGKFSVDGLKDQQDQINEVEKKQHSNKQEQTI